MQHLLRRTLATTAIAATLVVGLDNTCTVSTTACNVANDTFGRIIATRAAREIQLGLKLYW